MNPYKIIDVEIADAQTAVEPLTLADAKKWLKVTFADDDSVITGLISSCRKAIEEFCTISIIEKDISLIADLNYSNNRSCIEFEIPYGPVLFTADISEIIVSKSKGGNTSNNFELLVLDTDYWFDGVSFYRFKTNIPGRYKFVYSAKYATVPPALLLALKVEIAYRYENRGDIDYDMNTILSAEAKRVAQPYKRMTWL